MLENDSGPKAMYTCNSITTLQQENTNKIEKKTLLKLVFMQFTFKVHGMVVRVVVCMFVCGWVGGEGGVCYSIPLNCAVFVTEDVQVFSPHSEH